jgi:hypothetical protein
MKPRYPRPRCSFGVVTATSELAPHGAVQAAPSGDFDKSQVGFGIPEDVGSTSSMMIPCRPAVREPVRRRIRSAGSSCVGNWQPGGFDRVYGFHCLRHSAISSVYRMTHDPYLAQRFARHQPADDDCLRIHPIRTQRASARSIARHRRA